MAFVWLDPCLLPAREEEVPSTPTLELSGCYLTDILQTPSFFPTDDPGVMLS